MTSASNAVEKLVSYSATDWSVSDSEEKMILNILIADPSLDQTIKDLKSKNLLRALVSRVDIVKNRSYLLDGKIFQHWSDFVFKAYQHVKASGVL